MDRELYYKGSLASSIGLFNISDELDPVTKALSSSISKYSGIDYSTPKYSSLTFLLSNYLA